MPRKIRILIVDEEGIMRDALSALLAGVKGFEVVGTASSGRDAIRTVDSLRPDVVIMDFTTSMTHGPETIPIIRERQPDVRVLMLTFHREDHFINATLRAGADGYVLKNDSRADLLTAVRAITAGKSYISAAIRDRVVEGRLQPQRSTRPRSARPTLTRREQEVIRLIAQGYRTREIAQSLSLSHKTVEKHRASLMRKLGLRTATAVAAYAIAEDYVNR